MKYLFILLFLIIGNAANAAAPGLPAIPGGVTHIAADTDTVIRKQSISIGANYGSDIQFFGRTGPVTYPYLSTDAIYNFKSGIFVYGSAVQVIGYYPLIDEVDLGTGYLYNY